MKTMLIVIAILAVGSVALAQEYHGSWIPISLDDMPNSFFGEWYSNGTWNVSAHYDYLRTGNVFYEYGAVLAHTSIPDLYCLVLTNDSGWRLMTIKINNARSMDVAEHSNVLRFSTHVKE